MHDWLGDEGVHRELVPPLFPTAVERLLPPQSFPVLQRLVDFGGDGQPQDAEQIRGLPLPMLPVAVAQWGGVELLVK